MANIGDSSIEVEKHLRTFDELDFNVFSKQRWDRLPESHADDIVVTWPDGHETKGLSKHVEDLKAIFAWAPDTKIARHPIKFGTSEWTAVTGEMTGTFTSQMTLPNGTSIPPTGKSYRIPMATIGHWRDGVMDHEWLFWDSGALMQQLGIGAK